MWWPYESNRDLSQNPARRNCCDGPHGFGFGECTATFSWLAEAEGPREPSTQHRTAAIRARDSRWAKQRDLSKELSDVPYGPLCFHAATFLQNRVAERSQEDGRCLRCSHP